jgi:cyclopropane-fatty-acyl-phospholipid synthase
LAGRQRRRTSVPAAPAGTSESSARRNVHVHYDLGNDFYRLWLDDEMVYTCAYFARPEMDLETAQRAKLDYVCRKLDLRPGEHVIEAGCGWGALALHMARSYGVTVDAYNVSAPQLDWARQRAVAQGLSERVNFINADYRSIDGASDAFVSLGMLEHVGLRHYADLGAVIDRVLHRAHGRGLLHFIGRNAPWPFNAWTTRYIFPGAYAPSIGEVATRLLEPCGFSIVDVENLRRHYAETLHHWRGRFEQVSDRVMAAFDEGFVRTWRLYLASAEPGFLSGDLQLFQLTFARPADGRLPRTRHLLYADNRDGSV